jgi:TonB family protein
LDEKAMDAVSKWQFQPGAKSGQAVPVQAQIQVNFRLLANNGQKGPGWHLGRAEFRLPDGALRAVLEKVAFPHVADDANSATATVTFDVNEKGEPVNAKIEKSSDDEWGRAVTNALGKWRFTPASKDGVPVTVSCTMDFVRGN